MTKILIVEDDRKINQLVATSLQTVGYTCLQAYYGMEALRLIETKDIDLIILDIQLPDTDGFKLIKSIKTPVIYLTARSGVADRVKGLNLGAEDYIIKPFAIDELLARVQVVLRRFNNSSNVVTINNLSIHLEERKVFSDDQLVELTPREFCLLETFLAYKNMALSREQLIQQAWGMDYEGDIRTVDVHVQRLRKKLHLEKQLSTVYKFGYRLEV